MEKKTQEIEIEYIDSIIKAMYENMNKGSMHITIPDLIERLERQKRNLKLELEQM